MSNLGIVGLGFDYASEKGPESCRAADTLLYIVFAGFSNSLLTKTF